MSQTINLPFTVPYVLGTTVALKLSPSSPPTTQPTINKAVGVYGWGWTSPDATFVAEHFGFLDTDFNAAYAVIQSIKAQNPNVIIVGYKDVMGVHTDYDDWAEVNSHEDWFVHDANGNRILNTVWGWYLMDVGNVGWRQHYVSYVNSKLASMPAFDGVFADDVWNTMTGYLSVFNTTVPSSYVANFHANMIGFLQYLKANLLSGKIVINNSDEWGGTNDYINITDGELIEGFAHAPWDALTTYGRPYIDVLANKCATGKLVCASSGIDSSTATQTQLNIMLKFCYASFLMGMSGPKAYWLWSQTGNTYNDLDSCYQPIMDTALGQPTNTYYQSQNVYMRDFTGGKALVNPSANSYTVSLGGTYKLLDGTTVSSVTLQPHSGEILLLP